MVLYHTYTINDIQYNIYKSDTNIKFEMKSKDNLEYIEIQNDIINKDLVLNVINKIGGKLDTWTEIHLFSAIHETLMFAMMNNISNHYVDFLRYIYMSDINFTALMKNGKEKITKHYIAQFEYCNKNDILYNFHKVIKVEEKNEMER